MEILPQDSFFSIAWLILLHVGEGVVLRAVAVGPGEHRVGLAERAGTLPLTKAGILASHDYIIISFILP